MPTTSTPLDATSAERIASAFNRHFETLDGGDGLFSDDVFFDLYPPFWRFQVRGPEAITRQLRVISQGPSTTHLLRVVPTATGFVMEHEEAQGGEIARRMWLCEVRDGLITDVVGYCNGGWDQALRTRHAAEAPMLDAWETAR